MIFPPTFRYLQLRVGSATYVFSLRAGRGTPAKAKVSGQGIWPHTASPRGIRACLRILLIQAHGPGIGPAVTVVATRLPGIESAALVPGLR